MTALVVNPGLPTARHYDRDDLLAMVGGESAPVGAADAAEPGATGPAAR